jgi:hypothetical protein
MSQETIGAMSQELAALKAQVAELKERAVPKNSKKRTSKKTSFPPGTHVSCIFNGKQESGTVVGQKPHSPWIRGKAQQRLHRQLEANVTSAG